MSPGFVFRWLGWPFRYAFSKIKKKIGKLDRLRLEVFLALSNGTEVLVKGRVVEAYRQSRPSSKKSALQNILATLRRYAGSSVPDARVRVQWGNFEEVLITDSEGVFESLLRLPSQGETVSDVIFLTLIPEEGLVPEKEHVERKVRRIDSFYPRAVISDIDDTVIISKATNLGEKLWLSVSKNAYTRRPFPGVSEFYQLITRAGRYPVYYVSSSDWNLFDLIRDFLEYRKIPRGPILLKDAHVNLKNIWKSGGGNHDHKLEKIRFLMDFFPQQRFLLIGDSGQHDPELYAEIVREFPGRVEAVYIRRVGKKDPEREKVLNELLSPNQVAWVKTTAEAMQHAKKHLTFS
ncbi:Phosphatidate phosphatase APP1 [Cyclobacterium lianum]|uniref:Phosphatidate phosphatase APP1 n=1 Tax=Cyclobacterium lianum TaxID=388280 RepID=A0A1M7QRC1_9BACT|nr:phosphatase domain-containing protein [Cyclobacterium lianum]SHN33826.1 Phosphatidate phosphatase APP1 [Cyclobacterium lianum]